MQPIPTINKRTLCTIGKKKIKDPIKSLVLKPVHAELDIILIFQIVFWHWDFHPLAPHVAFVFYLASRKCPFQSHQCTGMSTASHRCATKCSLWHFVRSFLVRVKSGLTVPRMWCDQTQRSLVLSSSVSPTVHTESMLTSFIQCSKLCGRSAFTRDNRWHSMR